MLQGLGDQSIDERRSNANGQFFASRSNRSRQQDNVKMNPESHLFGVESIYILGTIQIKFWLIVKSSFVRLTKKVLMKQTMIGGRHLLKKFISNLFHHIHQTYWLYDHCVTMDSANGSFGDFFALKILVQSDGR